MLRFVLMFLSMVTLVRAGGVVCAMGGYPKVETPGLVELLNEGRISHERLDDIRALRERIDPRFEAVKEVFVARGPVAVPEGASIAEIIRSALGDRLRGVCLALDADDRIFALAVAGTPGMEQLADGSYRPTGKDEGCDLCAAVQAAAFRPLDAAAAAGGELPGARLARAHEANAVLAAWREGLRAILSAEEWNALAAYQRDWLHKTVTTTVAEDPRVRDGCESCSIRVKCELCAAVEEGVKQAKEAEE